MSEKTRSSKIEHKLYTAYHQDGLLDIVSGIALMLFSGVMLFDQSVFIGTIALPLAMYIPLKQQITVPRQGYIRFTAEKETRRQLFLTLFIGIGVFTSLLIFYALGGGLPSSIARGINDTMGLILGMVLGLILVGAAYILHNTRFYYYAMLGVTGVWVAHFISIPLGISVAGLGLVALLVGMVHLYHFLRLYPLPEESRDG